MAKSEIHLNEKVVNTERVFGSALEYFPVKIESSNGMTKWAMFTEREIKTAIERADKNQEDIPKSFWESIFA